MDKTPIFIHSNFRAGSTYIFSEFRKNSQLNCYYEPMHELVAWASEEKDRLTLEQGDEKMSRLRHPLLNKPYFSELLDAWPSWRSSLSQEAVYGGYFSDSFEGIGSDFYSKLVQHSQARAVFCECRTAGRIPALKRLVGGRHSFLWRNPWDQWWSYQIDPYFEAMNQIILRADPLPKAMSLLAQELRLTVLKNESFSAARDFYIQRPMAFFESYALFFGLWLSTLDIALRHADLLINIDFLGTEDPYTRSICQKFEGWGVSDLDFSEASIPRASYTVEEQAAFDTVEASVKNVFLEAGWSEERLFKLDALRRKYAPPLPRLSDEPINQAAQFRQRLLFARAGEVSRSLAWGLFLQEQVEALRTARLELEPATRLIQHLKKEGAHQRSQLERVIEANESFKKRLALLKTQLEQERAHRGQLLNSISWRMTMPGRALAEQVVLGYQVFSDPVASTKSLLVRIHAWISLFPSIAIPLRSLLHRFPTLKSRLTVAMGFPQIDPKPVEILRLEKLSPRAIEIHNLLAEGLGMPEMKDSRVGARSGTD